MMGQMALEPSRKKFLPTQDARLFRDDRPFTDIDSDGDLGFCKNVSVKLCEVIGEECFSWEKMLACVAEPLSSVSFDFVVIPFVSTIEETVGLWAVVEGTDIWSEILEYVLPTKAILAWHGFWLFADR